MHRRWYWKIYLLLWAGLLVAGGCLMFYRWDETEPLDRWTQLAAMPMYVVQIVGLYGFVYQRRIASPRVWMWVIGVTLLELIWTAYPIAVETEAFLAPDWFLVAWASVAITLSLPLLIGLCIYAFRSEQLWRGTPLQHRESAPLSSGSH